MKEDSSLIKKIYLICYSQPRYREEIKKFLYGDNKKSYPYADGLIDDMLKEKAGFPLAKCEKKEVMGKRVILQSDELTTPYIKPVTDGRATRGDFLISKTEPIVKLIKYEIKEAKKTPELTFDEEKTLASMLKDNRLRESFEISFSKIDFQHQDVDPDFFLIHSICLNAAMFYGLKRKFGKNLDNVLQMMSTDKQFDNKAKKIIKKRNNIQEALELVSVEEDNVLKIKKVGNVFNKADYNLLNKLMKIDPQAASYASVMLMLQNI